MTIALDGASKVAPAAKLITLSAKTPGATNSITEPTKIVPVEGTFRKASGKFTYTVPAYSIQILELETR